MFSKIYYINLDRRLDRDISINNELKKININKTIEKISAIDGKNIDFNMIPNNLITKEGIDAALEKNNGLYLVMTKGAIGCALSHKYIYEKMLYNTDKYILILEDDIWFDDNFNDKLIEYTKDIPEYDILFLGYHEIYNNDNLKDKPYMKITGKIYGLYGYIINKKAAKELIELFPLTSQIDSEMAKIFSKLNTYALKENYRIIHSQPSQIADKFGTDIQHREYFNNVYNNNSNDDFLLCIFIIIIIILMMHCHYY